MATREGIYVGGHEIIERYVGSKLVWEKFVLIKKGKITLENKYGEKTNEIHFFATDSNLTSEPYLLEQAKSIEIYGILFTKVTINHLSNNYIQNEKISNFRLTFSDAKDKAAFVSVINSRIYKDTKTFETKFYKKKR